MLSDLGFCLVMWYCLAMSLLSVFSKICMETVQVGEKFRNINCAHAFCRVCIHWYILEKALGQRMAVKCPECEGRLDPEFCKDLLPPTVAAMRTNALCKSTLHLSESLYCPFKDCSKLIWYDTKMRLKQTKCPYCQRLFCAECMVEWHYETNCKEYLRRIEEEVQPGREEDQLLPKVARHKNWRRCPDCKYFVEKISGWCFHIKCSCGIEFCYGPGMKPSSQDRGCCG